MWVSLGVRPACRPYEAALDSVLQALGRSVTRPESAEETDTTADPITSTQKRCPSGRSPCRCAFVTHIHASRPKSFYTDYLGLSAEEFNMGWVARFTSPATGANVQLVSRDATAPEDSVISVQTDDVDGAYEEARELGYEIVHPITTEPWGVRRFLVRAPDGSVINVVRHRD